MKKPRIAMVVNDMNINGISTVIINYCSFLDENKFDVSIISGAPVDAMYKKKCILNHIRLFELPERKKKKVKYYVGLFRVLKKGFDIVHCCSAN